MKLPKWKVVCKWGKMLTGASARICLDSLLFWKSSVFFCFLSNTCWILDTYYFRLNKITLMSQLSVDIMENGMVHKLAQLLWNYNKSYKIIYYSCTVLSKARYKKLMLTRIELTDTNCQNYFYSSKKVVFTNSWMIGV